MGRYKSVRMGDVSCEFKSHLPHKYMFNKIAKKFLPKIPKRKCNCDNDHWCSECLPSKINGTFITGNSGDGSDARIVN